MASTHLQTATRWLGISLVVSLIAFALLTVGRLTWAGRIGLLAAVLVTLAGLRTSRVLGEVPEDERIGYPYDVRQRGRRLAWTGLLAAAGLAGFVLAPGAVESNLGQSGLIVVGAAALLAPPVALMVTLWTVDGISLRSGDEEPGDPLIGAVGSMVLGLVLAALAAVTGWTVSFALIAAFGGLVPSLFGLWAALRIHRALEEPVARPIA